MAKGETETLSVLQHYKKSGVLLMGLHPKHTPQPDLFADTAALDKSDRLMQVMDTINRKMGKGSLTIAATGSCKGWYIRRELKSPDYTTDWQQLPEAR